MDDEQKHFDESDNAIRSVMIVLYASIGVGVLLWLWTQDLRTAAGIYCAGLFLCIFLNRAIYVAANIVEIRARARQMQAERGEVIDVTPNETRPELPPGPARTAWAKPFTPAPPRVVVSLDASGHRIEASYDAVKHFIDSCYPIPNREKCWKMEASDYGKAAAVLCAGSNAPLLPSGRTFAWRPGVKQDDLWRWLQSTVDHSPPPPGQAVEAVF